jgi:DNA repair ATPase RecN
LEQAEAKVNKILVNIRSKLDQRRNQKSILDLSIQQHRASVVSANATIQTNKNIISNLESVESKSGTTCPTCYGIVKPENFQHVIDSSHKTIEEQTQITQEENKTLNELNIELKAIQTDIKKHEASEQAAKTKSSEIANKIVAVRLSIGKLSKINKPQIGDNEKIIEQQIIELKEQITAKKSEISGKSPYENILKSAEQDVELKRIECKSTKEKMAALEEDTLYYDWLAKAHDNEIRSYAISGILKSLNSHVAYWLQILIDGKIKLTFDVNLEETIERNPADGDPFVYYAMSGGERRRLNLAVSQAFASIMMHNANYSPSLVFLDEVTSNVDPSGVDAIFRMIGELSRQKQVFITTHDQGLLSLLSSCDKIELQKKDGFTKLV